MKKLQIVIYLLLLTIGITEETFAQSQDWNPEHRSGFISHVKSEGRVHEIFTINGDTLFKLMLSEFETVYYDQGDSIIGIFVDKHEFWVDPFKPKNYKKNLFDRIFPRFHEEEALESFISESESIIEYVGMSKPPRIASVFEGSDSVAVTLRNIVEIIQTKGILIETPIDTLYRFSFENSEDPSEFSEKRYEYINGKDKFTLIYREKYLVLSMDGYREKYAFQWVHIEPAVMGKYGTSLYGKDYWRLNPNIFKRVEVAVMRKYPVTTITEVTDVKVE